MNRIVLADKIVFVFCPKVILHAAFTYLVGFCTDVFAALFAKRGAWDRSAFLALRDIALFHFAAFAEIPSLLAGWAERTVAFFAAPNAVRHNRNLLLVFDSGLLRAHRYQQEAMGRLSIMIPAVNSNAPSAQRIIPYLNEWSKR